MMKKKAEKALNKFVAWASRAGKTKRY